VVKAKGEPAEPDSGSHAPRPKTRLLTPQIVTIILIALCTYLGFGMVTVVLPGYVTQTFHGGTLSVAIVVGIYSFAAVLARPWAGRLGDSRGRRSLMILGAFVICVSFGLAAIAPDLGVLVGLRLLTGTGEGMFYIGSAALVTDLVPAARRAEAIGYFSVALYLGSGLGPTIGHSIAQAAGFPPVFLIAGALAGLAAILSTRLPNHRVPPVESADRGRSVVNRAALIPGIVLFFGIMGLIPFQAYVPLYSEQLHMSGPQYVFLLYSSIVCGVRLFGSRIHRMAPERVAGVAIGMIVTGLALMASVASPVALYLGAAVFAGGVAMQFPALMGLALERGAAHERASVVGTYTAFMDLSQGAGGFVLGVPAALLGYRGGFFSGSVSAFVGLLLLRRFSRPGGPLRRRGATAAAAPSNVATSDPGA
jgi:MFS family permease